MGGDIARQTLRRTAEDDDDLPLGIDTRLVMDVELSVVDAVTGEDEAGAHVADLVGDARANGEVRGIDGFAIERRLERLDLVSCLAERHPLVPAAVFAGGLEAHLLELADDVGGADFMPAAPGIAPLEKVGSEEF